MCGGRDERIRDRMRRMIEKRTLFISQLISSTAWNLSIGDLVKVRTIGRVRSLSSDIPNYEDHRKPVFIVSPRAFETAN